MNEYKEEYETDEGTYKEKQSKEETFRGAYAINTALLSMGHSYCSSW